MCFLVISVRDDSTRAILQENVFDPILNRVNVNVKAASFERQKKIRQNVVDIDDDKNWKYKNFNVHNWIKSIKVELTDESAEKYFRLGSVHTSVSFVRSDNSKRFRSCFV